MQSICVFCGSAPGADPRYAEDARQIGRRIARGGYRLVYGGSNVGLMGALADAALDAGGLVTGVIPQSLVDREVAHRGLSDLRVVGSMHERKALMADLADAFVAMPGGYGTFDELCEILTWAQLQLHAKPVALLNTLGYWDPFLGFLGHAVQAGFLKPAHRELLSAWPNPPELLAGLEAASVALRSRPSVSKWCGELR